MRSGKESKDSSKSEGVSIEPMKFGNRSQFKIALTELKWKKQIKGTLTENDYAAIAEKYNFPSEFLKECPNSLSSVDDYKISESKWYPILYSWLVYEKECSNNLYRLQFDVERTQSTAIRYLVFLVAGFMYIDFALQQLFQVDLLQRLSIIALPLVLSVVALIVEFRNNLGEKRARIEDYSTNLKGQGLTHIIEKNQEFINKHHRNVVYAGHILLRKFQEAPIITGFHVGTKEQNRQPTRGQILLKRLHLLQGSLTNKKEIIPIFYVENADIEYKKRIGELEKEGQD